MQITTLPLGRMQANCYIVQAGDGTAAVVDPGDEAARLLQHLQSAGLRVTAVWLTHGHFDHIGAADALRAAFSCPIVALAAETALLADPQKNLSSAFSKAPLSLTADTLLADGDTFAFGGETVGVLHTPGTQAAAAAINWGSGSSPATPCLTARSAERTFRRATRRRFLCRSKGLPLSLTICVCCPDTAQPRHWRCSAPSIPICARSFRYEFAVVRQ